MFFSATIPEWLLELKQQYLGSNGVEIDLLKDNVIKTPKDITHYIAYPQSRDVKGYISQVIKYFAGQRGSVIIFCDTKR